MVELTVVIVNWNSGDQLRRCLASLRRQAEQLTVQVVVVDNASLDGSREMAEREFPEFQIIDSGGNLGFARGNNLARPYVKSPYVLFLNPDTEVLGDALNRMVKFIKENADVGMLSCRMLYPDGSVHEQGLQNFPSPFSEFLKLAFVSSKTHTRFKRLLPYLDPQRSGYASKLYGGCLLVRKEAMDRAGWFDERYFMYAEDVDLCRTVADLGWRLYYLSEAEIMHVAGGTSGQAGTGFSTLMQCESIAKLMQKYYGDTGRLGYVLAILSGSFIRLAAVSVLRALSLIASTGRRIDYRGSILKYRLMMLWSLGLRRPVIAR